MSQYLVIYAKHKEHPDIQFDLIEYSTSIAREFSNEGIFPYTQDSIKLDMCQYNCYIEEYKKDIQKDNKYIDSVYARIETLQDLISKASNKDVVDRLLEELYECENSINAINDELCEKVERLSDLKFVISKFDNMNKDWDLYYINCS